MPMTYVDDPHSEPVPRPDRTLPANIDAERAVLGAVLVDNAAWPLASSIVGEPEFFRDAHKRIWRALQQLANRAVAMDYMTLREELGRAGDLEPVGGLSYVLALTEGVPRATNVEHYARIVREKARLRELIYAANRTLAAAYDAEMPPEVVAEEAVRELLRVGGATTTGYITAKDALSTYMRDLDSERGVVLPTGFVDLDDLTGGLERRKLTIVAARPSVGKSSFALALADHLTKDGTPVGFVALEMDPSALMANLLAGVSRVPSDRMRRKSLDQRDWGRTADAVEEISARPLHIVHEAHTLAQVQGWARRLVDEHGVQALLLDYIQLLGDPQSPNRQAEIAYFSRGLKRMAKDLDIAMVALSQLSRASESRNDKRPHLSDLRESGALEQDADLVLLLFRGEMYKATDENRGVAEVIIAKNRQGPTGTAKLCWIGETARFENLALL